MFEAGFAYILSKSLMNTRTTANVVNFIATSLLQFQAVFIQKKFLHAHRYIALVVSARLHTAFDNNNLLKGIVGFVKGTGFLFPFAVAGNLISRLNIIPYAALISNKVDFQLFADLLAVLISFTGLNYTHIHIVTAVTMFSIKRVGSICRKFSLALRRPMSSKYTL